MNRTIDSFSAEKFGNMLCDALYTFRKKNPLEKHWATMYVGNYDSITYFLKKNNITSYLISENGNIDFEEIKEQMLHNNRKKIRAYEPMLSALMNSVEIEIDSEINRIKRLEAEMRSQEQHAKFLVEEFNKILGCNLDSFEPYLPERIFKDKKNVFPSTTAENYFWYFKNFYSSNRSRIEV